MLIQVVYFYELVTNPDDIRIVVRNNFGQQEIIEIYSNKSSVEQELSGIKNRLNSTGIYRNGIFYPKTGEYVQPVSSRPSRKKILVGDEYLRS
jgi:hypothetical protein